MTGDADPDGQSTLEEAGDEDAAAEPPAPETEEATRVEDGDRAMSEDGNGAVADEEQLPADGDGQPVTDEQRVSADLEASDGPQLSDDSGESDDVPLAGEEQRTASTEVDSPPGDSLRAGSDRVEDGTDGVGDGSDSVDDSGDSFADDGDSREADVDAGDGLDVDPDALDADPLDPASGEGFDLDVQEAVLGEEPSDGDDQGLFEEFLDGEPIFENKEVLRPSYTPRELPHRSDQINEMATVLVSALRGDTPSNILIYGKTGTGKTASAQYVSQELERTSQKYEVPCDVEYINCEVTDTQYRVLAKLANEFNEENRDEIDERIAELEELQAAAGGGDADDHQPDPGDQPPALSEAGFDSVEAVDDRIAELEDDREDLEEVPMTGWPTDRVYNVFFDAVDYRERVVVIMLDEIDKLVEKSGDDTLYNLSRMNSDLDHSRVSIIGISNDLKFTDLLDPRVKSSLGEEEIVFPPYDATQLQDILEHRAAESFKPDALSEDVIPLCAAFAAQEHGDARRALDLLRTAGELAERDDVERIQGDHVRKAQEKIELDRVVEVVRTLPMQSKLVLFAIVLLERKGVPSINTGEVYNVYDQLCDEIDADSLTQRRVTDLISELDMLGIVNAVVVSKGRYGRTKEINLSVPIDQTEAVLTTDSRLGDLEEIQPHVQVRFDS